MFKATWVAIAAGSLAGLAVLGACSDDVSKVTGTRALPNSPLLGSGVEGIDNHRIQVCVDVDSDEGPGGANYAFSVAGNTAPGGFLAWFEQKYFPPDPDLADAAATASYTPPGPYIAASNSLGPFPLAPFTVGDVITTSISLAPGDCQDVFVRANTCVGGICSADPFSHVGNRLWTLLYGGGVINPFGAVTVTGTIPSSYTYNVVCTNNDPQLPQTPACGPTSPWSATTLYAIGDAVTYNSSTWRALTATTPTIPAGGPYAAPVAGANWEVVALPLVANPIYSSANVFHGSSVTYKFTAPPPPPAECVLGYPHGTLPAKTATIFNESEVLSSYGRVGNEIRVWYTDEHALTLGVDSLFYKNKAPLLPATFSEAYLIEKMVTNPDKAVSSPDPINVGSAISIGLSAALDGAGRPLHPAMFITDITPPNQNSKAGDWQLQLAGAQGVSPNAVYGTWKGAVIVVDSSRTPPRVTITPRSNPAKNHKIVGVGAGVASAANGGVGNNPPTAAQDLGFSAELVWNISDIPGYNPTHNYRLQFMVHDGDQNKTGGDVGQACLNVGPGSDDPLVVLNPYTGK